MAFEHISPGNRWQPSSIEINAMKDVARAYQGGSGVTPPGLTQGGMGLNPICVRVKNATGGNRDRYTVFSLGEPTWTLDDSRFTLPTCIFSLDAYSSSKPAAILIQPLKANEYGYACVAGPCLAKITGDGTNTDRVASPNTSGVLVAGSGSIVLAHSRPTSGGYVLALLGTAAPISSSAGLAMLTADVGAASYSFGVGGTPTSVSCPSVTANPYALTSSTSAAIDTSTTLTLRNTTPIPLLTGSVVQWKSNAAGEKMIDVWVCGSGGFVEPEP